MRKTSTRAGRALARTMWARMAREVAQALPSATTWRLAGASITLAASAAQAQTLAFDIPAQPLAAALGAFSQQARQQLLFEEAEVAGRQAQAVRGQFTPRDALERLLAGSGVGIASARAGGFALRAVPTAPQVPASNALREVTVTASATPETAWGPVHGYAATRSATGTKTDTPLIETPQSISVVSKEALETQGTSNVADALRYTAGVAPAAYANGTGDSYDSLTVRGFLLANSGLLQDGLRLKYNIFEPPTEAYGLERIEVLRGPSSTLYGQSGPSGVVNFVSKRPQAEPLHAVELQVGSFNRRQIATDHAGPLNADGTLTYRLTALARKSDSFVDLDRDDREYFAPALTWRPDAATSLTVLASYIKTRTGYYIGLPFNGTIRPNPDGVVPRERSLGEPALNFWNSEGTSIGYLLDHRFNDTWKLSHSMRYVDVELDYAHLYPILAGTRTVNRQAFLRHDDSSTLAMDTNLQATWSTDGATHTSLLGFDYAKSDYFWRRDRGPATPIDLFNPVYGVGDPRAGLAPRDNESIKASQLGVYAQQQSKFGQHWVLTAGLRHDEARSDSLKHLTGVRSDRDDNQWTGRLGLNYVAANGLAPYASVSTSFEPTAYSYFDGRPFEPTTGKQVELGIKYQPPGKRLLLTAAVFDLKQQNVATQDPDQINHPGGLVQTGEIASKGLEVEASGELTPALRVRGALTLTDAKVTRSNRAAEIGLHPADVPESMLSLWADYSFRTPALQGWTVGLGARYVSGTHDETNLVETPARTLVDALVGYRTGDWQLALNVTNLLDKTYINSCRTSLCWYGRPREVRLTARYGW